MQKREGLYSLPDSNALRTDPRTLPDGQMNAWNEEKREGGVKRQRRKVLNLKESEG